MKIFWRYVYKCYFNPMIFGLFLLSSSFFPNLFLKTIETNTTRVNVVPYLLFWGLAYFLYLKANSVFLKKDMTNVLLWPTNIGESIAYGITALVLFIWCLPWMEWNVFGFFFFIPFALALTYFMAHGLRWLIVDFNIEPQPSTWFLFFLIALLLLCTMRFL